MCNCFFDRVFKTKIGAYRYRNRIPYNIFYNGIDEISPTR